MKLIGGLVGYRRAVRAAFDSNMFNPCVVYSIDAGFIAQPRSNGFADTECLIGDAYYDANSGAQSLSGSRAEYDELVRPTIAKWLNARAV